MLPKYLKSLCCVPSPRESLFALDLQLLPSELIFRVLNKMQYYYAVEMMKTCSTLNGVGEAYREQLFTKRDIGAELHFFVDQKGINVEMLGGKSIRPSTVKHFKGLRLSLIYVNIQSTDMVSSEIRRFFEENPLKCRKLVIDYAKFVNYFPLTDLFEWTKVAVDKHFGTWEPAGLYIKYLEELREENKSELFEVNVYGSMVYGIVDHREDLMQCFHESSFSRLPCC